MEKTKLAIQYVTGDATNPIGEGRKVIVHVNNAQGGWGAGFVLALSRKWSKPERMYTSARNMLKLGFVQAVIVEEDIIVMNMVAQNLYPTGKDNIPLVYVALEECLNKVANDFYVKDVPDVSIHMPRIGAGLAGGSWAKIEALVIESFIKNNIPVFVYDLPTDSNHVGKSLHFNK